ncbi:MAG: hypothetical protein ACYC5M_03850 [Anaerolineae bacterium]
MAPIEVFFGALVLVFCLIGLVRGFLKELGVTTVLMFLLFFLTVFEPYMGKSMMRLLDAGSRVLPSQDQNTTQTLIFVFIISAAAFVSYQGQTLAFQGQAPHGLQGAALGLVTGGLNGYLIAGSLWFYLDKFGYALSFWGFASDKLSPMARAMIPYLPPSFLGQPVLLGQSLLLYLSGLLLLARVIR